LPGGSAFWAPCSQVFLLPTGRAARSLAKTERSGPCRREHQKQARCQRPRVLALGTCQQRSAGIRQQRERGVLRHVAPRAVLSRRGQSGPRWVSSCGTAASKPASDSPAAPPVRSRSAWAERRCLASDGKEGLASAAWKMPWDFRMCKGSTKVNTCEANAWGKLSHQDFTK